MKQEKLIYTNPSMEIIILTVQDILTISVQPEYSGNLGGTGVELLPEEDF